MNTRLAGLVLVAVAAFGSTTVLAGQVINCESENYRVEKVQNRSAQYVNYFVNGERADQAEPVIQTSHITTRVIAVGIALDNISNKIEIGATRTARNTFRGKIYIGTVDQKEGKAVQDVICRVRNNAE